MRLPEELLNSRGCEVCVCTEIEELRSQMSRLQSRNRELELQSSGRNSDHARQIRQVRAQTWVSRAHASAHQSDNEFLIKNLN